MPDTVVSLTAIPPRFAALEPTLNSLLQQSLPFREIRLNIPYSYRRFPGWDGRLPQVPTGVRIERCAEDLGPATKILPTARDLRGQDVDIMFCDDDKIYDKSWHARFKKLAARTPGTCIVEAGETFPDIPDSHRPPGRLPRAERRVKGIGYRLFRISTLGLIKPGAYIESGYVDQISAWGGVMVRPDWFDDEAFDIPDILWTVDDPWLSGHLERKGIPIWLNARMAFATPVSSGLRHALLDHVEQGYGRVEADIAAINHFREKYGIWQKASASAFPQYSMTASMQELFRQSM